MKYFLVYFLTFNDLTLQGTTNLDIVQHIRMQQIEPIIEQWLYSKKMWLPT
jgi:hypothetical protein